MEDTLYICSVVLLVYITGCEGEFCKKRNPASVFGEDTEICTVGCCGPSGDQYCCISNGLFIGLIVMSFIAVFVILVCIGVCYRKYRQRNFGTDVNRTPYGYHAGMQPTVTYMNNPVGTGVPNSAPPPYTHAPGYQSNSGFTNGPGYTVGPVGSGFAGGPVISHGPGFAGGHVTSHGPDYSHSGVNTSDYDGGFSSKSHNNHSDTHNTDFGGTCGGFSGTSDSHGTSCNTSSDPF
ncbi:hypothetical protein SNE40_014814 [Patella caerulea]|uniref:Uncharacterized protein n=1 Tax=Patella caerulea TaxID=87958 RepID=A0AAN8JEB6_PATCE